MFEQLVAVLFPVWPQIFIVAMICVILLVDLFLLDSRKWITYCLAQLTLIGAAYLSYKQLSVGGATWLNDQVMLDPLAVGLELVMYLVIFLTFLYARVYTVEHKIMRGEFHVLTLISLLGGMVLVSANSLLTVYLGLELLSLPLYAMIAMRRDAARGSEAAIKYFILGAMASGILLYGMSLIYGMTGSIFLDQIAAKVPVSLASNSTLLVGLVLVMVAAAIKLSAVPFHMWAPDAYEGSPTSVTSLLGTLPKLAVLGLVFRLIEQTLPTLSSHWTEIWLVLGVLSLFIGNMLAIVQKNIKRMLAYSTIGHVGFILVALSLNTPDGNSAALFYMMTYAIMTVGGFGVIMLASMHGEDADNIEDYTGLNDRNPWLAFMMLLLLLSMAGIPPLIGFDSKFYVLKCLVDSQHYVLATYALLMSVVGAYYYVRMIKVMYFDKPLFIKPIEMSADGLTAISINGLAMLGLGFFPSFLLAFCQGIF
ncbi:MAG: NADH-quinone oxidoreductase subunit NuoN [Gammaproteobacteria bacterium]|nr:NADH-quinone oxidoreductase subunit NuoN [Gammaproteobacteria bacterium]